MRPIFAAILFAAAGCTPQVPMSKPGGTQAEYERDSKVCKAQADRAAKAATAREASKTHNRVLLGCMRERGWEQVVQ